MEASFQYSSAILAPNSPLKDFFQSQPQRNHLNEQYRFDIEVILMTTIAISLVCRSYLATMSTKFGWCELGLDQEVHCLIITYKQKALKTLPWMGLSILLTYTLLHIKNLIWSFTSSCCSQHKSVRYFIFYAHYIFGPSAFICSEPLFTDWDSLLRKESERGESGSRLRHT